MKSWFTVITAKNQNSLPFGVRWGGLPSNCRERKRIEIKPLHLQKLYFIQA